MKYERYDDCLKAPNGRTVRNLRKDAKATRKSTGRLHNDCLDDIAKSYGAPCWETFHTSLIDQSVARIAHTPCQITQAEYDQILHAHPDLTQWGFGVVRRHGDDRPYTEILADERDTLRHSLLQCNLALTFINLLKPQRAINSGDGRHSYDLKHVGEHAIRKLGTDEVGYVCHGAFIAAAIFKGFLLERANGGCFLNLDEASPILYWRGEKNTPVYHDLMEQLRLYQQSKDNDPDHQEFLAVVAAHAAR